MTMDDLDAVMSIEETSFDAPWSRYAFEYDLMHNPHANYFVYLADEGIIGYTGLWIFETVGHIVNMAVSEQFRRHGVAKKMLDFVMNFGKEKGVERFTLEVRKSNESALRLYESNGFVNVGIRPGYYQDNREDAVIMWTPSEDGELKFS